MWSSKTTRHQGLTAVVVGGPGSGVVAQVGGDAGGHGGRSHGPALPLQEEGPGVAASTDNAEGVGMDGMQPALVTEVARGLAGRVQLDDSSGSGKGPAWPGRRRRRGRRRCAPRCGSNWRVLAPATLRQSRAASGSRRAALHRLRASPGESPVPAGQHDQPPIGEGQAALPVHVNVNQQVQLCQPLKPEKPMKSRLKDSKTSKGLTREKLKRL